jgi:hypothetical protein
MAHQIGECCDTLAIEAVNEPFRRNRVLNGIFDHLHLHRLEAQLAAPNLASARALEKLGFQEEGRLRERQYVHHQFVDERMFALINVTTVSCNTV